MFCLLAIWTVYPFSTRIAPAPTGPSIPSNPTLLLAPPSTTAASHPPPSCKPQSAPHRSRVRPRAPLKGPSRAGRALLVPIWAALITRGCTARRCLLRWRGWSASLDQTVTTWAQEHRLPCVGSDGPRWCRVIFLFTGI